MNANLRRALRAPAPVVASARRSLLGPLATTLALAACVPAPQTEAPPPRPHARPQPTAPQPPAPTRPAIPQPAPSTDWRDAPATPGNWQWSQTGSGPTGTGSSASFANGQLVIRCDRANATVSLLRADPSSTSGAGVPVTITTTSEARTLTATRVPGGIGITLPARDRLLDAMVFSRGRFAFASAGTPTLYIPSWTEVSRVVEDCR